MYTVDQLNESGKRVFATGVAFACLTTIVTVARLSMRLVKKLPVGWDDYFALCGLLGFYGCWANSLYADFVIGGFEQLYIGFGSTLSPEAIIKYEKALFAGEVPYAFCLTMCRLSALWLYRRIFRNDFVRRGSVVLATASILWCIGSIIGIIASCIPLAKLWKPELPGHCALENYRIWYLVKEVVGAVIDFIIVFLPIRSVSQLQLPFRKKVYLMCIFAFGIFVAVTCLIRISYLYNPGQSGVSITWGTVWSLIHTGTAVCCISLPLIGPLLAKISLFAEKTYTHIINGLRSASSRESSGHPRNHLGNTERGDVEKSLQTSENSADACPVTWTEQDRHGTDVMSQIDHSQASKVEKVNQAEVSV